MQNDIDYYKPSQLKYASSGSKLSFTSQINQDFSCYNVLENMTQTKS